MIKIDKLNRKEQLKLGLLRERVSHDPRSWHRSSHKHFQYPVQYHFSAIKRFFQDTIANLRASLFQ